MPAFVFESLKKLNMPFRRLSCRVNDGLIDVKKESPMLFIKDIYVRHNTLQNKTFFWLGSLFYALFLQWVKNLSFSCYVLRNQFPQFICICVYTNLFTATDIEEFQYFRPPRCFMRKCQIAWRHKNRSIWFMFYERTVTICHLLFTRWQRNMKAIGLRLTNNIPPSIIMDK